MKSLSDEKTNIPSWCLHKIKIKTHPQMKQKNFQKTAELQNQLSTYRKCEIQSFQMKAPHNQNSQNKVSSWILTFCHLSSAEGHVKMNHTFKIVYTSSKNTLKINKSICEIWVRKGVNQKIEKMESLPCCLWINQWDIVNVFHCVWINYAFSILSYFSFSFFLSQIYCDSPQSIYFYIQPKNKNKAKMPSADVNILWLEFLTHFVQAKFQCGMFLSPIVWNVIL